VRAGRPELDSVDGVP